MKNWTAYAKINGDGYTRYQLVNFDIDDETFIRIQGAVNELKPLSDCDFYKSLYDKAEMNIDYTSALPLWADEPNKEDFENEEEYKEELKSYNSMIDDLCLDSLIIEDPGDLARLKKEFVGQVYSKVNEEFGNEYLFEYIDDYDVEHYCGKVVFNDKGVIKDIVITKCEGIESVSIKYTNTSDEVYPDYSRIENGLKKDLSEYK